MTRGIGREDFFRRLARDGRAPLEAWPGDESPDVYGLAVTDGWLAPVGGYDPLAPEHIRGALSRRAAQWLRRLDVYPVIGSTNAELMSRAVREDAEGSVCLAELQLAGRGRRGRGWFSPFAANLALSLAMRVDVPPPGLGGVSLVVGLAALDALEQLGIPGLGLKWPNDVLLRGGKLGGILIEMVQASGTLLVIGIGMNVALPAQVRAALPRGVTDLSAVSPRPSRSVLAGKLVSTVVEFVEEFARIGFPPFKAAFDARHDYHRCECRVLQGDAVVTGTVAGVTDAGELLLETADGRKIFSAGEVSLRTAY